MHQSSVASPLVGDVAPRTSPDATSDRDILRVTLIQTKDSHTDNRQQSSRDRSQADVFLVQPLRERQDRDRCQREQRLGDAELYAVG